MHDAVVRPVGTLLLVVAATLLLAPAILVNWTRTEIYDTESFTDNAVAALEDEAVRAAVVQEIVNEIVTVGSPELIAIRPLIEFVTATVVDSLAFREIFRDSVEQLHVSTFRGDDSAPVALTIVDAVIVVTAYLEQAYPELTGQLPATFGDSFIEIRSRDWAVRLVALGEDATELAVALPLVMSLLYGSALVMSRNRRQTLVWVGMGWVTVAAFLVVGRDLAREIVLGDGFQDQAVRDSIWDAYTRSLVGWSALFGGFGLLLAVAATATQRVNPARQFELLFRAMTYSPESQWAKVLRAGLFIIAGLLVVSQREEVLQIAVLLAAAYLVYYGLSELIWLASGGTPETFGRWTRPSWQGLASTRRIAIRSGAFAALVLAAIGGLFFAYQALDTAGGQAVAEPRAETCNGYEQLCDRRLDEVVFLGTHNSMSAASVPSWYFSHQLTGISTQLQEGVRVLLLDTYYGFDTGRGVRTADRDFVEEYLPPGRYSDEVIEAARRLAGVIGGVEPGDVRGTYLCHVFCELGATPLIPTLTEINRFIEANPGEVIFLLFQDNITPEDTAKAFIASGLVKHVHTLTPGEPLPTLRELVESDERVLVFADNDSSGVGWYMPAGQFIHDTPFTSQTPSELSCDHARGEADSPLFALNHWLSESFPSTASASRLNDFDVIYRRVSSCHRLREDKVNFLIVNFYELGDADAAVDYLNGVAPRPPRG